MFGRRLGLVLLGGALAALAAHYRFRDADEVRAPRDRASALFVRELEALALGDERETLRLMHEVLAVDSGHVAALVEAGQFYGSELQSLEFRAYLDRLANSPDHPLAFCARTHLAYDEMRPLPVPAPTDERHHECLWYREILEPLARLRSRSRSDAPAALWRRYPESRHLATVALNELATAGEWDSVLAHARRLTAEATPSLLRATGVAWLPRALHALGRHDEALAADTRALDLVARSPARVRVLILELISWSEHALGGESRPQPHHADSLAAAVSRGRLEARAHADPVLAWYLDLGRARHLTDNGDLKHALALWDSLVPRAEATRHPLLRAETYLRRGRTLAKLGDAVAAERDLLIARRLAPAQWRKNIVYETEHNLLHLYEAHGPDESARRAGESYVRLAAEGGVSPALVMSRRDFGWFLQRRGETEAARRVLEPMIAEIDSLPNLWDLESFAGEYFELIGDLDRAALHYRRALETPSTRALLALTRVAETTGDTAAAMRYAREHDAAERRRYPEYRPLLPGVLARSGNVAAAEVELARARQDAAAAGRTAGWAQLTFELAELRYARGIIAGTGELADSAARSAAHTGDAETALRARALGALARVALGGDASAGSAELERLAKTADRMANRQLQIDLLLRLGDARSARRSYPRGARSLRARSRTVGFAGAVARARSNVGRLPRRCATHGVEPRACRRRRASRWARVRRVGRLAKEQDAGPAKRHRSRAP